MMFSFDKIIGNELTDHMKNYIENMLPNRKIEYVEEGTNVRVGKNINRYVIYYDDTYFITHVYNG